MHLDLKASYEILGVQYKEPFSVVSKAYKKLALQFHPDKCKVANGQEQFLKIQKAFEYIKKNGSRGDPHGLEAQPDADANEANQPCQQPEPNEFNIALTLEEIFTGVIRKEKIIIKVVDANGSERKETKKLDVNVKPGSIAGSRILVENEGDRLHGKIPANVIFIVVEVPHDIFKRSRFDLEFVAKLTTEQACNRKVTVPNLEKNGKRLKLTINQVITANSVERVPGKGLPFPTGNGKRGDLLIRFDILYEKDMPQDPAIEYDLYLTLEEIHVGQIKKMKITRSSIDPDGREVPEEKVLEVPIPPGVESGWRYSFEREGDQKPGKIPADINFTIHQKIHSHFIRQGANIKFSAFLSEAEASHGVALKIPTLDEEWFELNYKSNMENPMVFPGKGLPLKVGSKKRGDMIVNFKVGDNYLDPPIEQNLPLTLTQILNGCTLKRKITQNIEDREGNVTTEAHTISIDIKPGIESSSRLVFPRLGNQYPGRIPADIVFIVTEKADEYFRRKGANIEHIAKITKHQLSSDEILTIPSIEATGEHLELSMNGILNVNAVKRFRNRGLPFPDDPTKRGSLLVRFEIVDSKDEPIEQTLELTEEQLRNGTEKKLKIQKLIDNCNERFEKVLKIQIEPETAVGTKIVIPREGDHIPGRIPADLIFTIKRKGHKKEQDPPIYLDLPLSQRELDNGTCKKRKITRSIFSSDGSEGKETKIIKITIPPGTAEGAEFTYKKLSDGYPGRIPADIIFVAQAKMDFQLVTDKSP